MDKIDNYDIIELLSESRSRLIYRAINNSTDEPVTLHVIKSDPFLSSEIASFRREYENIKDSYIDGVIKILDIVPFHRSFILVNEYHDSVTLKDYVEEGALSIKEFLSIARRLSEILGRIHEKSIIHKDIRPHNILINKKDKSVKISNFGLSMGLKEHHFVAFNKSGIHEKLYYLSPEQTGRMNRHIDYRTDLYSLGVTFYFMLVGSVPFISHDALEVIHSHIAKEPVTPATIASSIPQPVSDIIMKLLEKNPEDRYQNSFGLMADLQYCINELEKKDFIDSFTLGKQDVSLQFNFIEKIFGRNRELQQLLDSYTRVGAGGKEAVIVTGQAGIGKSTLIQEAYKPVITGNGYFIFGKYDPFRREKPYSALLEAFNGLIRQILTETESRITYWKERITSVLDPNGIIMAKVLPDLELLIDKQPRVAALDPEEAHNRFNLVFKNFISLFASAEHPLAIFLDDLQWVDAASIELIKNIITDEDQKYILLIGAYRDNDVSPNDELVKTLDEIQEIGVPVTRIELQPLEKEVINDMIIDFLRSRNQESLALASVVHRKTAGNPFFVNQFLKNLYDEKLLTLDPVKGWQWERSIISTAQVTENVVEFIAQKIARLTPLTAILLKICSCIGNSFDLQLLADVSGTSLDQILDSVTEAMFAGLITKSDSDYIFQHDRIREAAYSFLTEQESEDIHYRIGSILLQGTREEKLQDKIFDIVNQLNYGEKKIISLDERIHLARLNLIAGTKAKNSMAHDLSVWYIRKAMEFLPYNSWDIEYSLTYEIYKERMECEYLNRNYKEAEKFFSVILKHASNVIDKIRVYAIMTVLFSTIGNYTQAIDLALKGLKLVNVRISRKPSKLKMFLMLIDIKRRMGRKSIEDIIQMPDTDNKEILEAMMLITAVKVPSFYIEPYLYAQIVLKETKLILTHGNSDMSPNNFMTLASILGSSLGMYDLSVQLGRMALELYKRYPLTREPGNLFFLFPYYIQHWKTHARNNIELFRESYRLCLQNGGMVFAAHSINNLPMQRIIIGDNLDDIFSEYRQYDGFIKGLKDPFVASVHDEFIQFYYCLKGLTPDPTSLQSPDFDEKEQMAKYKESNNKLGIFYLAIIKIRLFYLFGEYSEAYSMIEEFFPVIDVAMGDLHIAEFYFYYCLTLLAISTRAGSPVNKSYLKKADKCINIMKNWADSCPENFLHKYLLMMAEKARVLNNIEDAMQLYQRAITSAHDNDYTQNEGIAHELATEFYSDSGFPEFAAHHAREARNAFIKWGALAKVRYLERKYTDFISSEINRERYQFYNERSDREKLSLEDVDLQAVIKISQAISGEIDLDMLINRLLHIAKEYAGAQEGCIILENTVDLNGGVVGLKESQGMTTAGDSVALPESVINYVRRTEKHIVLDNAFHDPTFRNDPVIKGREIKSVLCMPVKEQNKLIGLLYLENNLSSDVFSQERIGILEIFAAQAAISMKNALLYSERKQAQELLLAEKERLMVTLRSIGEGVIAMGIDKKITIMNKAAEFLTGWPQDKAIGMPFDQVFRLVNSKTGKSLLDDSLENIFSYQEPIEHRDYIVLCDKDGFERNVAYTIAPINDHRSLVIGAIIVFRDITEKIKLEKELLKNQKLESLSIFAGGIAHDFNNILTGITGNVSLALMQLKPDDELHLNLSLAEKACIRAIDLTRQLLTFSQGGNPIKKSASVASMLKESVGFILSGTKVKCEFGIPYDLWPVEVDEGQINQVINNLVINAVQSMPDGGTIYIVPENCIINKKDNLPIKPGEYVRITIRDEGIGIPEEDLSRIFDPFFTTKTDGTGLGLASTYSILKKHGGHITVESSPGKGASFDVYLPASENKGGAEPSKKEELTSIGPGRVLLMDDEEMILKTGRRMLQELGLDADTAHHGEEAIAMFKEALHARKPYDFVIMDLTVPGHLGGLETLPLIKDLDPTIKAIASSGYSNDPVMHEFRMYGFNGILVKPYRMIDMKEAIIKTLKK